MLKTSISFSHQFPGLSYPLVKNEKWVYSIVPMYSKIVKKLQFPEILNLKLVEANLEKDPILKTIRDAIRDRKRTAKKKSSSGSGSTTRSTTVRENCFWMDGRLAMPKNLATSFLNRLHHNHHGPDRMFAAAKDVSVPLMHLNFSATAKFCKHCQEARKSLKPDIPKHDMGRTYKPKEPNDFIELDFWGPVNYIKGGRKMF